jgi:hypothetical protein
MARRRLRPAAAGALLAVLTGLGGCAAIPTTGPVVAGPPVQRDAGSALRFQPAAPADGAGPESIVRGFLLASSGVEEDHAVARSYLSAGRAQRWRPGIGTVVFSNGSASVAVAQGGRPLADDEPADPAAGEVVATLSVQVEATIDGSGRYTAQPPGTRQEIDLTLRQVDGQWRIDEVPDQLVIDQAGFDLSFSPYRLYFADPTGSFLVPETRWFPERRSVATTLATELIEGPSPWLAQAVHSGFPPGVGLTPPLAVPIEDGRASVDLTDQALSARAADRAVMYAQLQATLLQAPAVTSVRITVGSGELALPGSSPPLVRDPVVDQVPVLVLDGTLVHMAGGAVAPAPQLPPLHDLGISHPAKGSAAYAALAHQRSQLLYLLPGAGPELLLTGADLTPPSIDPRNWTWSTNADCGGVVTAARPGAVAEVDAGWLAGRRIVSLRISRDGTRALVASTDADGRAFVDLAGVHRDDAGRPLALQRAGEQSLIPALTSVLSAVWTSEAGIAVLGRSAQDDRPRVYLADPLGPTVRIEATVPTAAAVVSLAAGPGERSLLLGAADGTLWKRAGAQWVEVVDVRGVRDPAFAG